jgi:aspartate kinase
MFANGEVLVQKFGGSSMAGTERIRKVAQRLAEQAQRGRRQAVVVSAMGDTTDDLIGLMRTVQPDTDPCELDQIMATGEIVSAALTAGALQALGIKAKSFHAINLGIRTIGVAGSADIIDFAHRETLARFLKPGAVAVIAGFQGLSPTDDLTTLGRGGSDITAVAIARELGQKVCEKYTDEDGVYTADPRIVPMARKIWHLDYEEMETLARFGNGILHPRAISWAREAGIRIHVRSSFTREEGTVIGPDGDPTLAVKSLATDRQQVVLAIEGIPTKAVPDLHAAGQAEFTPILWEWVPQTPDRGNLRISFRPGEAFAAIPWAWHQADRLHADEVRYRGLVTVLSVVGSGLAIDPGLAEPFLRALNQQGIFLLCQEQTGRRLSLAVEHQQAAQAQEFLHRHLCCLLEEGEKGFIHPRRAADNF